MSIVLDRPENATVRHDRNGITITRKALISEVGGPPDRRARAALETPQLPRYGDSHPAYPQLRVSDVVLRPIDVKQWDATIIYREPRPEELAHMEPVGRVIDVQWFSTIVTEEKVIDANGRRMLHIYSGWPEVPTVSAGRLTLRRSSGRLTAWKSERAEIQIPAIGVRVLIVEAGDPSNKLGFVSRVNSGFWSGYLPKTWLFVGPVSGSEERGRWLNTYELLYRPDTWRLESIVDVQGAPPSNATEGNGIEYFDIYEAVSFGALGFSI